MKKEISKIPYISPDGSDRTFSIIEWNGKQAIKIIPSKGDQGLSEAKSYVQIGRHLRKASVPVPEIYDFSEDKGLIIAEFVEGRHLQETVREKFLSDDLEGVVGIYKELLLLLSHMQVKGREGFDPSWCYDTPSYDSRLAFEREALYFLRFFVEEFMGLEYADVLLGELKKAAEEVDKSKERNFFLHRDFQSRNILYNDEAFRVIDFQAGRLGPLAYDLSSLLLDPYVNFPKTLLDRLIEFYMDSIESLDINLDPISFIKEFYHISLLRTLQVLGAFSFLTLVKNKPFFRPYIAPALYNLNFLLAKDQFRDFSNLRDLAEKAAEKYEKQSH